MSATRISLCVITGQEAVTIERFLDSFKDAFDELCIVRAVGNQPHDGTLGLAKDWCRKNGKEFKGGVYDNVGTASIGDPVDDDNPATWGHVDDFAAARNMAWSMATGNWQFWADVDDVLVPEATPSKHADRKVPAAELIRLCAASGQADRFFFTYDLRAQQESNVRERLFRTGSARWTSPVHETCRELRELETVIEAGVIFEHAPKHEKQRDPMRNRRIMQYHLRHLDGFAFDIFREWFYEFEAYRAQKSRTEENERKMQHALAKATYWAEVAYVTDILPATRFDLLLKQARLRSHEDVEHAIDLVWSAIRTDPKNRSGWGDLAEYELRQKRGGRALMATQFMQSIGKRRDDGVPQSGRYHGWEGFQLRVRALRAVGNEAGARAGEEEMFAKHGRRISLLHATRGRPQQALETRALWLRAAFVPLGVEHIFAIDADDAESLEALKEYRHVVVGAPSLENWSKGATGHPDGGCVAAWNAAAAASSGHVLVQLSDDWVPCHDYDDMIFEAFARGVLHRNPEAGNRPEDIDPKQIGEIPMVLAVHDGHRKDALLCMAILTRARYLNQCDILGGSDPDTGIVMDCDFDGTGRGMHFGPPYLFAPDYFGVFSDNEFTVRAYDDGVVVQAQHIVFEHRHPVFGGTQMDETYARQNAPERYAEGLAIFNRRNPKHAINA